MWSPSFTVAPWNLGTCSENKTTDLASVTLLLRGFSPNTVHTVHRKSEECMWHAANHRFNPQAASGDSVSAETDTRTRDFLWIWGLFMPQWPSSHRHSRTHEHKHTYKDSCTDTHTHVIVISCTFPDWIQTSVPNDQIHIVKEVKDSTSIMTGVKIKPYTVRLYNHTQMDFWQDHLPVMYTVRLASCV